MINAQSDVSKGRWDSINCSRLSKTGPVTVSDIYHARRLQCTTAARIAYVLSFTIPPCTAFL